MLEPESTIKREWKQIERQLAQEQDPTKVLELPPSSMTPWWRKKKRKWTAIFRLPRMRIVRRHSPQVIVMAPSERNRRNGPRVELIPLPV